MKKVIKIVWSFEVLFFLIIAVNFILIFNGSVEVDLIPFLVNLILLALSSVLIYYSITEGSGKKALSYVCILFFIIGAMSPFVLFFIFSWNVIFVGPSISVIAIPLSGIIIFKKK